MTNLKEEIKKAVRDLDVVYVQINDQYFTYQQLLDISDFEYDDGFGEELINSSLRIIFQNGSYLMRFEYDGSEWFELILPPNGFQMSYFANTIEFSKIPLTREILVPREV
jgi:hypothetical protein